MEKRLLNVKEACEYLGATRQTILKFGELHGFIVRVNRKIMLDKVKIDKWLDEEGNRCSSEQ